MLTDATFLATINEFSDAMVVHDANGNFLMCNEAFRTLAPDLAKIRRPGMHARDILKQELFKGLIRSDSMTADQILVNYFTDFKQARFTRHVQLADDRSFDVIYRRLENTLLIGTYCEPKSQTNYTDPTLVDASVASKPQALEGTKVLLVSSDKIRREAGEALMRNWGFDFLAVATGLEAVTFLKAASKAEADIDCILLDYKMPDLGGDEIVQGMRNSEEISDYPVIMVTGDLDSEDQERLKLLNLKGRLAENAPPLEVYGAIERMVRSKQQPETKIGTEGQERVPEVGHSASAINDDLTAVKILVCEDNSVNQIVFSQILEGMQLSYKIANNGKVGLDLFAKLSPELILMDISMPEMNGLEATHAIRQLESDTQKRTPIIGVTAHAVKGDRDRCFDAGMDDYLSKPVSPQALSEKINFWLHRVREQSAQ